MQSKNKGFPLGHLFLLFFLLGFIGLIYQQSNTQNLTEENEPIILEKSQKNFARQSSDEDSIKYENNFESDQSEDVITEISLDQENELKIQFEEKFKIIPKNYHKEKIFSWSSTQYFFKSLVLMISRKLKSF